MPSVFAIVAAILVDGFVADGFVVAPPSPPVQIEWLAPKECPTQASVEDAVRRWLEDTGAVATSMPAHVSATVESVGSEHRLSLRWTTEAGTGERVLQAQSCEELANTAALLIAMAVDPTLAVRTGEATTEPAVGPDGSDTPPAILEPAEASEAATAVPVSPQPTDSPAPPNEATTPPAAELDPNPAETSNPAPAPKPKRKPLRETLSLILGVHAGYGLGPLPLGGATLDLRFGVQGLRFRVLANGAYWPPVEAPSDASSSAIVRAQLWTAGVRGCGLFSWRSLDFPLCGGLDLGAMRASATSVSTPGNGTSPYCSVIASVGIDGWIRPWVGLSAQVEGLGTVLRPIFFVAPSNDAAHTASPVGGRFTAGVSFRLR